MAYLAPSLRRLFNELDVLWPHRDRRTDGWIRWPKDGISVGHNPDSKGCVHAIDVDKDGINPEGIIANIFKNTNVLWYIIWNRGIWSNTWGFTRHNYTGSNPHTDHMHIEIRQTAYAENYAGGWNISVPTGGGIVGAAAGASGGSAVGGAAGGAIDQGGIQGLGAADDRDPTLYMSELGNNAYSRGLVMGDLTAYGDDTLNL